jgi:hypothetical protein
MTLVDETGATTEEEEEGVATNPDAEGVGGTGVAGIGVGKAKSFAAAIAEASSLALSEPAGYIPTAPSRAAVAVGDSKAGVGAALEEAEEPIGGEITKGGALRLRGRGTDSRFGGWKLENGAKETVVNFGFWFG